MSIINFEIQNLKNKKVIVNTDKRIGDYISGVFTKIKKYGSHRMILNLKNFNKFVCCRPFKMESIQNVLNVIKKDAFMTSIDLKDAFYSVPVTAHYQIYLKLLPNEYLKFICIPNTVRSCHENLYKDYESTIFSAEDVEPYLSCICRRFFLQGDSYESYLRNINDTIIILQ